MATWTAISDTVLEPGKPVRSVDGLALRDNPIAIAEGAAGAPRIASDSAINWGGGGTGNTSAANWVLARNAAASVGAVGTYAFLALVNSESSISPGQNVSGSSLRYSGIYDLSSPSGTSPSGTWKCMGFVSSSGPSFDISTMFLRIS